MSIIVCGEDFSSNLAHKDLLEISYLRIPDNYFCSDSLLFHIYCVSGELPRCLHAVENSPVYTHQKLSFVFHTPQTNTDTTGFGLLKLRS